jgi:membrane fusion protein, heavy metal efflux system
MTYRAGLLTGIIVTAAVGAVGLLAWSGVRSMLQKPEAAKPVSPATVPTTLKEEGLLTLTLTPDAERRLGIQTAAVVRKPMPRSRTYAGEVTVPPGQTVLVAAPVGGVLRAPAAGVPKAGAILESNVTVFELAPLLSPDARPTLIAARVDAAGQVQTAQAALEGARITLDRMTKLFREEAGSRRAVEDAQAAFDLAQKTLDAAKARLDQLTKIVADADKGTAEVLQTTAPAGGLLRTVNAHAGQTVPLGAALFEVIDLRKVWVRTAVFVGEVGELDANEAAVGPLVGGPGTKRTPAKSVEAPPTANPMAGTVDLYFHLDNPDGRYRPGERVGVTLPLKAEGESLTVPWSAVLHDIHGGTWVYEALGGQKFVRRRVQVRYIVGETAVLASGPPPGTRVVAVGAAELFGTEVGFGK